MATLVLLRLAALTGERRYRDGGRPGARDRDAVPRPLSDRVRELAVGGRTSRSSGIDELAIVGDPAGDRARGR